MSERQLRRDAHAVLLGSFSGPTVPGWLARRVEDGLGGVCLFAGNLGGTVEGARSVAAALHRARPDVVVATDEEGGDVTRLWASTGSPVPGNAALGAVDDLALTAAVSGALGAVLADAGIDLVLAPVADVNTDPANPAIGVRSFGADPALVARHVGTTVEALQAAGVAACAKHFPGHGATRVDSHDRLATAAVGRDVLGRRELVPFGAAIDAGVAAVMSAHLHVPALDTEPATFSQPILGDLLRGELGFGGAVVTDALDMGGAGGPTAIPAAVVRALAAGADLCCLGSGATDQLLDACVGAVVDAVRSGALTEARLGAAATRAAGIRRPVPPVAPLPATAARLEAIGNQAAFRALRLDGQLPADLTHPHVLELQRPPMVAAGDVPWGLGPAIAALDPGATVERIDPDDVDVDLEPVLRRASGRPLVVVVRDTARRPAQVSLLADVLAARPDAVVVDVGWPDAAAPGGAARITTFGAAPPSTTAAARLLVTVTLPEELARG